MFKLEPYLDNRLVLFGGNLPWLASPALALMPCQPGKVRSPTGLTGVFSEKYIPTDLLI